MELVSDAEMVEHPTEALTRAGMHFIPNARVESLHGHECVEHVDLDNGERIHLDPETKAYGKKLPAAVKDMFEVIHEREDLAPGAFLEAMEKARERIIDIAVNEVPSAQ